MRVDDVSTNSPTVVVPRALLKEVVSDGCCPLHLRLQLSRLLRGHEVPIDASGECLSMTRQPLSAHPCDACHSNEDAVLLHEERHVGLTVVLHRGLLASIAAFLPLAEVLATRACGREPLQWAMEREAEESHGPRHWIHDRIRARLWMRRVEDLTAGTSDESVFETRMKSLADRELRSRMEAEMQEALTHMEQQIHTFQAEVDRRLNEQEEHVRRLVEQRVQEELDSILVAEVAKVQAVVEDRVRERVSAIFRREVRATVRELQSKLDVLAEDNEVLRDAFAEANLRSKSQFWALYPPLFRSVAAVGCGLTPSLVLSLRRRTELACAWHVDADWGAPVRPPERVAPPCRPTDARDLLDEAMDRMTQQASISQL